MLKREQYLEKIRNFYDSDLIKILVGIRRSGKSVILSQIIQELKERGIENNHIIYVNFEFIEFEELTDTLASNRLDNVVSALMNTSRSKATEVINRGFVSVNHLAVTKTDFEIEEGDILSLRGGGRFIADSLSDKSRKGRIIFKYRKFI